MTTFIYIAAAVYAVIVAGMYVFQRKLMYLPDNNIASPEEYGLSGFTDRRIATEDGVMLQIWYRPAANGMPTVAYFHGNAAHLGNRAGIYAAFAEYGLGVLALSYRGYGKSQGMPSEEGLYHDARAAIGFLSKTQNIPLKKIILFGESLGSGVAVQMATEFDIGLLALEAPYTSVAGRAAEIYPYIPVRFLIKDRYDSIHKIARVKAPVILFHGELDGTIPVAHGRALLEKIISPKQGYFFPQVAHNDFDSRELAARVLEFARKHGL